MFGTDLVNAKRVINTKLSKNKPNPENLTLAERILLNRRKGPQLTENSRKNSPSGSVDISEFTNHNDERRTPTPEPTRNNRSPVKRQESNRSIKTLTSEQPGPSNRKSSTPPLPPIKSATPRPATKVETPRQSRAQSKIKVESRRETPVLPPIERKDSRVSVRSDEGIQPPKDMREFDPNLGVGDVEDSPTPQSRCTMESQSKKASDANQQRQEHLQAVQKNESKPRSSIADPNTPEKQTSEKDPDKQRAHSTEKSMSPVKTNVAPVVAAAATTSGPRLRSRSVSGHRSRSKSHSRSRSRSRNRSKERNKSRSRSRSRRRSRRSKSRKRHRSSSYSSNSSPHRHRRNSFSPIRRHRSRGRSRSKRGSFDYDFERAKSIVRSLSRMESFSRPRYRSPSIEYQILGNTGFWPTSLPESSKKKKKIIIVQGGGPVMQAKRRSHSSSDSDISVIVKNIKSKLRGKKEKIRRVSDSDESDSSRSVSRARIGKKKRQSKPRRNNSESEETDVEEIISKKNPMKGKSKKNKQSTKNGLKKKNLRFDLKNVSNKKRLEKKNMGNDETENESEEEVDENENVSRSVEPAKQVAKSIVNMDSIVEKQDDVAATGLRRPTPDSPFSSGSLPIHRKQASFSPSSMKSPMASISPYIENKHDTKLNNKLEEDNALLQALDQLEKRTDFELEQLKGGNQRKLPPDVNLDMKKKIFSKEFQQNINNFLES